MYLNVSSAKNYKTIKIHFVSYVVCIPLASLVGYKSLRSSDTGENPLSKLRVNQAIPQIDFGTNILYGKA